MSRISKNKGFLLVGFIVSGLILCFSACTKKPASFDKSPKSGAIYYFVPVNKKIVALTFDDGPNGIYTSQILDILKAEKVKATFFLVGTNVEYYPEIVHRTVAEGHEIGNHSYAHLQYDKVTPKEAKDDMERGLQAIKQITGITPHWLRPPYGINSPDMEEICRTNNMAIAGWSADANDWNPHPPEELVERLVMQVVPGDIILLHDGRDARHNYDRSLTVQCLMPLIQHLHKQGFSFVTLTELIKKSDKPYADFSNGIKLLGLQQPLTNVIAGKDYQMRYFWEVPAGWAGKLPMAFVHLIDARGNKVFQNDHPLQERGDVRDRVIKTELSIPKNMSPGKYRFSVGLFDPRNPDIHARVPVASAFPQDKHAVALPVYLVVTNLPSTSSHHTASTEFKLITPN
jgi:peptidoglycan/xylan/chitin deacetylase (PgdA/CDA1 family)